jgi:hypothetical protein
MRMIVRLLLLASCRAVLFIAGVLATFRMNILIYGAEEFNVDAGAGFAVMMEGIFIGLSWLFAEFRYRSCCLSAFGGSEMNERKKTGREACLTVLPAHPLVSA